MRLYFLLAIAFLLFGSLAHSSNAQQNSTAIINGTVSDPSGAAITGATIAAQAIGSSKAEAQKTQSGNDGKFSLTLPPGRYRVSVEYR